MHCRLVLFCLFFTTSLVFLTGCDNGIGPQPSDDYASDEAPAWSPDGGRIAYFHWEANPEREGGYPTGLYVLTLATGARSLAVEGNASNPDWSPDGERIAFDAGDLFTVRPDGSDLRRATDFGSAFFPAWSPDGQRIAFDTSYEDPRGAYALWLVHPDGSGLRDISEHGGGSGVMQTGLPRAKSSTSGS
jgi:Tol biopolymer transport system component